MYPSLTLRYRLTLEADVDHKPMIGSSLVRRLEARAYELAHRMPPDLVVKLKVTPETAAKREPDMNPAVIRQRVLDLDQLKFPGSRVVDVDAELPLADVIHTVKCAVWRQL